MRYSSESHAGHVLDKHPTKQQSLNAIHVGRLELNSRLDIVKVHDIICHNLLGEKELVRINFTEILSRHVSTERNRQLRLVFDMLLSKQNLMYIDDHKNPFDCIKIRVVNNHGIAVTRYLRCEFQKHQNYNSNGMWLVTIRDVSRAVRIARKVKLSRAQADLKVSTVMSLIQFEKDLIEEFLEGSVESMKLVMAQLKIQANSPDARQHKLEFIYGIAHQMKGDASMLNLDLISRAVHDFEHHLANLNRSKTLTNSDFNDLRPPIKRIVDAVKEVNTLFDSLRDGGWNASRKTTKDTLVRQLNYLIKKVASDNRKQVVLVTDGDLDTTIPDAYKKIAGKLLTQLVRNSIVHGIEDIETRQHDKKTPYGCIHIFTQNTKESFFLRVRDDGAGINLHNIKQAALASGLFANSEIIAWNKIQTMNALFKPGFSTAKKLSEHAGRGIGLDVIKSTLSKYRGKVSIESVEGQFTEFTLTLPAI